MGRHGFLSHSPFQVETISRKYAVEQTDYVRSDGIRCPFFHAYTCTNQSNKNVRCRYWNCKTYDSLKEEKNRLLQEKQNADRNKILPPSNKWNKKYRENHKCSYQQKHNCRAKIHERCDVEVRSNCSYFSPAKQYLIT